MKVLVLGVGGMLGSDVVAQFESRGWEVTGFDREEFDVSNPETASRLAHGEFGTFDWVVNCAAYTAVDKAESEIDETLLINGYAPGLLASACEMAGLRFLHVSTDYVFDGTKTTPYVEEDVTNPQGAYGRSKLAGEEASLSHGTVVVRTSWLFGPNGPSFPRTMIRACRAGKDLKVVADQTGTPTYTADLARVLGDLINVGPKPGIYHAAGPDVMTWHEFAVLACSLDRGSPVSIAPLRTEDWPTPTPRPAYSVLSTAKIEELGIAPMRPVREALAEFIGRVDWEHA